MALPTGFTTTHLDDTFTEASDTGIASHTPDTGSPGYTVASGSPTVIGGSGILRGSTSQNDNRTNTNMTFNPNVNELLIIIDDWAMPSANLGSTSAWGPIIFVSQADANDTWGLAVDLGNPGSWRVNYEDSGGSSVTEWTSTLNADFDGTNSHEVAMHVYSNTLELYMDGTSQGTLSLVGSELESQDSDLTIFMGNWETTKYGEMSRLRVLEKPAASSAQGVQRGLNRGVNRGMNRGIG